MSTATTISPFEWFLSRHDAEEWTAVVEALVPSIHEVDRAATRIWFAFYPLELFDALAEAGDPARLAAELLLEGRYFLKDQIDTSHRFLYGHRYWPQVKSAVTEYAASYTGTKQPTLSDCVLDVAQRAAAAAKAPPSVLAGITAVAFMTIRQTGLAAFQAAAGTVSLSPEHARKSADEVVKQRAKDESQGLFGFLRTVDRKWTVTFDENDPRGSYRLIDMQDLAYGAADDPRDWRARDSRCIEGPIPVQCRSASCGTCWVGVLAGADRLSPVASREEKKLRDCGYIEPAEPKLLIRLACQALASGAVSIIIPPWNGIFGDYVRARRARPARSGTRKEQG